MGVVLSLSLIVEDPTGVPPTEVAAGGTGM
jgi:hypothetical protein